MADPRLAVDFEGLHLHTATFEIDGTSITYSASERNGSAAVGKAVTLTADDTISLAGNNEVVLGKLLVVHSDGFATVQWRGGMSLPAGEGATVTVGTPIVGDLGADSAEGYIQTAASGVLFRGLIVNNDDLTKVKVLI
jgi:hypothetical protein